MTSNSDQIVAHVQHEFQQLMTYVTAPESRTAYAVECTLFRRLLALGLELLRLFFLTRAAAPPPAFVVDAHGIHLPIHDRRPISYFSIFGKLTFSRAYYHAAGLGGRCPLDADLSLPERCYSDLLRDWLAFGSTDAAYRETTTMLGRIFGWDVSIQSVEAIVADDAVDVVAFYDQPPDARAPTPAGTILVAQADGKGVPMVTETLHPTPLRLGKGQKRTKKKEAIVTALYTIAPYQRTPEDVLAALLHETAPAVPRTRPQPIAKELRAGLDGKPAAIRRLAQRTALREGPHIQDRVALTDGAKPLQEQMQAQLSGYTLVLDIIHATEYLWDAATALFGETNAARTPWVRTHLVQILHGRTVDVITALTDQAITPDCTATQRKVLRTTIGYYQRNLPFMQYDVYLARGWPIGTGVVEGACGHLVKDRMEQTGMRWTKTGAQAMLDLRAVRLTGDWDAYWQFHRQRQHLRLYGTEPPFSQVVECQVLQHAA